MINQFVVDITYKTQRRTVNPKNIPAQFPILIVWEDPHGGLQANTLTYEQLKQKEQLGTLPDKLRFKIQKKELTHINGQLFERSRYWRPTEKNTPDSSTLDNNTLDNNRNNKNDDSEAPMHHSTASQQTSTQTQPKDDPSQTAWATSVEILEEIENKQITLLVHRTESENEINMGWYKVTRTGWLPQYHLKSGGLNPNYITLPISIGITTLLWLAHRARLRRISRRRQQKQTGDDY